MGSSLVLWRPDADAGPVTSLADALDRALRIPGAVAVVLGELARGGTLAFAQSPDRPAGFAHEAALSSLVYARGAGPTGEVPEELVLTGGGHLSLWQSAELLGGGHAFVQVTLERTDANLALARMGQRRILDGLPEVLAEQRARPLPRRTSTAPDPPPRRHSVPVATLQLILDRLRAL